MGNTATITQLVKLTSTSFFQLLSRCDEYDFTNENILLDAYHEFHKCVVDLCINGYSGTPAYFILKHTRIELCQLDQEKRKNKKKSINRTLFKKGDISCRFCFRLDHSARTYTFN